MKNTSDQLEALEDIRKMMKDSSRFLSLSGFSGVMAGIYALAGAGLSNLVFCQPGTKVLEFFPEKYVRHAYYDICNQRGLNYHYLLCPSEGNANNAVEGQKLNLTADISAIRKTVEGFVRARPSVLKQE